MTIKLQYQASYGILVLFNKQPRHEGPDWVTETSIEAITEANS